MEVADSALLALAVFAHAWVHRITAPPQVVNVCGWVIAVLFVLLVSTRWVHCG